jgi:hypothetical protein
MEFRGHQKPEIIELRYTSWERQMFFAVLWMIAGIVAFILLGTQRPWWRTIVATLLLTCVPLLWLPGWLPGWLTVCNGILAGWLIAFATHIALRLARWWEKKLAWIPQPEEGAEA